MNTRLRNKYAVLYYIFTILSIISIKSISAAENPYGIPMPLANATIGEWILYDLPAVHAQDMILQRKETINAIDIVNGKKQYTITTEIISTQQGMQVLQESNTTTQYADDLISRIDDIVKNNPQTQISVDRENIDIAGKRFDCSVLNITLKDGEMKTNGIKLYISDSIPGTGLVRMDNLGSSRPEMIIANYGWGEGGPRR